MKILVILNEPPYGSERSYNGLRLSYSLVKVSHDLEMTVFLMGDAVACAKRGQKTPDGYYNLERLLKALAKRGEILLCGSCMDARGIADDDIINGCKRSSLDELTKHTLEADKTLIF